MATQTADSAARTSRGSATRDRILAAANAQFYAHGIRATSADRIIEQVGITKVTFYRHFRAKGDLVVAYLEQQSQAEQGWLRSVARPGDPRAALREIAAGIGAASCRPEFRGCAFINAAAEFPDADDPVRIAVDAHRDWLRENFARIAAEAGSTDAEAAAAQLMMLRDGAMVNGYLGDGEVLAGSLEAAFLAVLDGASRA
ncbi:TetR/AcrR family transcriptional regulator [Microbacterium sp. NPDC089696]|uniref:TetR/AcrR family transcriptional regulator n=1 Tax=Microbacterium sp. NPDC089696 TaxID=3364199 RepID=UPI0037FF1291